MSKAQHFGQKHEKVGLYSWTNHQSAELGSRGVKSDTFSTTSLLIVRSHQAVIRKESMSILYAETWYTNLCPNISHSSINSTLAIHYSEPEYIEPFRTRSICTARTSPEVCYGFFCLPPLKHKAREACSPSGSSVLGAGILVSLAVATSSATRFLHV